MAAKLSEYLATKWKDVFDSRDVFESSRSLVRSLKRWGCMESFEAVVGDSCDYLAPGLEHKALWSP